jgi:hypothetical protein
MCNQWGYNIPGTEQVVSSKEEATKIVVGQSKYPKGYLHEVQFCKYSLEVYTAKHYSTNTWANAHGGEENGTWMYCETVNNWFEVPKRIPLGTKRSKECLMGTSEVPMDGYREVKNGVGFIY